MDQYKALVAPNCKLSQELADTICRYIAQGNYVSVACAAAGINPETLRRWGKFAEDGKEPYMALMAQLKRAEAQAEANRLARIDAAATDGRNWQALAWLLERTKPERYGQITRVHQTVDYTPEAKAYLAAHAEATKRLREAEIVDGELVESTPDDTPVTPEST